MKGSQRREFAFISGLSQKLSLPQQGPDKTFVEEGRLSLTFSGSGLSKSTRVVEVSNRDPKSVIQKKCHSSLLRIFSCGSNKLQNVFSIQKLPKS